MNRLNQHESAGFKLWILYFYIFWSFRTMWFNIEVETECRSPESWARSRCSVSLMNRLSQKSSVSKMWMLYFQRITFSDYFIRNRGDMHQRFEKDTGLVFPKQVTFTTSSGQPNKNKIMIMICGCFIRLRLGHAGSD